MEGNELSIVEYKRDGSYLKDIRGVLKRLNKIGYSLTEGNCNYIALKNNVFVGAFNLSYPAGANENLHLRVGWLSVTEYSEKNKYHIGSEILNYAKDKAKKEGLNIIRISVNKNNDRALKLYKRFGFNEDFYKEGEIDMKLVDFVPMVASL